MAEPAAKPEGKPSGRFADFIARGQWKTPLKVIVVAALAAGLGAAIAIVINIYG